MNVVVVGNQEIKQNNLVKFFSCVFHILEYLSTIIREDERIILDRS